MSAWIQSIKGKVSDATPTVPVVFTTQKLPLPPTSTPSMSRWKSRLSCPAIEGIFLVDDESAHDFLTFRKVWLHMNPMRDEFHLHESKEVRPSERFHTRAVSRAQIEEIPESERELQDQCNKQMSQTKDLKTIQTWGHPSLSNLSNVSPKIQHATMNGAIRDLIDYRVPSRMQENYRIPLLYVRSTTNSICPIGWWNVPDLENKLSKKWNKLVIPAGDADDHWVKLIRLPSGGLEPSMLRELNSLTLIGLPHVLPPVRCQWTADPGIIEFWYIRMNKYSLKYLIPSWFNKVNKNEHDSLARMLTQQMVTGLRGLHGQGIVLQKVTPSHVLLQRREDEWDVEWCDFGNMISAGEEMLSGSVHDSMYSSWETSLHRSRDVESSSDVFSLGLVLFELYTGFMFMERAKGVLQVTDRLQVFAYLRTGKLSSSSDIHQWSPISMFKTLADEDDFLRVFVVSLLDEQNHSLHTSQEEWQRVLDMIIPMIRWNPRQRICLSDLLNEEDRTKHMIDRDLSHVTDWDKELHMCSHTLPLLWNQKEAPHENFRTLLLSQMVLISALWSELFRPVHMVTFFIAVQWIDRICYKPYFWNMMKTPSGRDLLAQAFLYVAAQFNQGVNFLTSPMLEHPYLEQKDVRLNEQERLIVLTIELYLIQGLNGCLLPASWMAWEDWNTPQDLLSAFLHVWDVQHWWKVLRTRKLTPLQSWYESISLQGHFLRTAKISSSTLPLVSSSDSPDFLRVSMTDLLTRTPGWTLLPFEENRTHIALWPSSIRDKAAFDAHYLSKWNQIRSE